MIKVHSLTVHIEECLKAKRAQASLGVSPSSFTEVQLRTLASHPEAFSDISQAD